MYVLQKLLVYIARLLSVHYSMCTFNYSSPSFILSLNSPVYVVFWGYWFCILCTYVCIWASHIYIGCLILYTQRLKEEQQQQHSHMSHSLTYNYTSVIMIVVCKVGDCNLLWNAILIYSPYLLVCRLSYGITH